MAITVTGSTLTVTLTNATDLELGGHLTWSADNTYDVGASGASRARTGYFGTSLIAPLVTGSTSVVTPLLANAGTLALSATGANVVTFSTNGSERGRWSSGGNLLVGTTTDDGSSKLQVAGTMRNKVSSSHFTFGASIGQTTGDRYLQAEINEASDYASIYAQKWGTGSIPIVLNRYGGNILIGGTTDGNYRLDVQSSGSTGTMRVYDQTATVGVTSSVIRAGAGQSTTALTTWQNNAGTSIAQVLSTGEYWGSGLSALGTAGSENTIAIRKNAAISATNIGYYFAHRDTDTDLWLYRFNGTTYKNLLKFTYNGGTDQVQIASDTGMQLGFFGATPVAQQVAGAGDAAAIITALKNLGLMAP